jgi:hypothetical protein
MNSRKEVRGSPERDHRALDLLAGVRFHQRCEAEIPRGPTGVRQARTAHPRGHRQGGGVRCRRPRPMSPNTAIGAPMSSWSGRRWCHRMGGLWVSGRERARCRPPWPSDRPATSGACRFQILTIPSSIECNTLMASWALSRYVHVPTTSCSWPSWRGTAASNPTGRPLLAPADDTDRSPQSPNTLEQRYVSIAP